MRALTQLAYADVILVCGEEEVAAFMPSVPRVGDLCW